MGSEFKDLDQLAYISEDQGSPLGIWISVSLSLSHACMLHVPLCIF